MKNVMLNEIPKASFLKLVIEATNKFNGIYKNGTVVTASSGASAKLAGVKIAIADSGIGRELNDAIMNMLSVAIAGAKTATSTRKPTSEELDKQFLTFVPYACVVPLRNRNNHRYTIGEPVIMVHGSDGANSEMFGMDKNGCIINRSSTAKDGLSHLPRLRKSLRPATMSEIYRLVDALYA